MRTMPLCLCFFFLSLAQGQEGTLAATHAVLHGQVTDINGSAVQGARVILYQAGRAKMSLETDAYGRFEVKTREGIYTMSASQLGFCPTRRSAFYLADGVVATVELKLMVCSRYHKMKIDSEGRVSGEIEEYSDGPYSYEELEGRWDHGIKPALLFGKRENIGENIIYPGPSFNNTQLPARLTIDLLTFKSTFLTHRPALRTLSCEGNVTWSDGQSHHSASRITIKLDSLQPRVEVHQ